MLPLSEVYLTLCLIIMSGGRAGKETTSKNEELVHCRQFLFGRFGPSCLGHVWELPVLHYHEIMVIHPYPFLVAITQLLSWIIFINDCICILTGSPG